MPELPEVETIRLGLQKYLVGHKIENIQIRLKKQFIGDPGQISGTKITGVRRFGKGIVIDFANGFSLAIHVKMTGQLIVGGRPLEVGGHMYPDKWTHVIFKIKYQKSKIKNTDQKSKAIKNYFYLYYSDIRQFGWIKVVKTVDVNKMPFFRALGFEPLKDLTLKRFSDILNNRRTPIKLLLMDQQKIAGIGNIYANDALFEAKIHPQRQSSSLTEMEVKRLFNSIESVLKKGIEAGGASQWNYVNVLGEKGGYQDFFKVYNKKGQNCGECGNKIERIKMAGRGTFFCPVCQR